ncbi:uncharacterized protein LOC135839327 [Planococcus citri]|uniref:uncharacterized protein LOC135839327 n=1 Tax=Planococcus citri TaxID=170843 RepID=UPI0031F846B9
MFNSLKGKFQQVQDGISASIRNLKIKDEKSNTSSAPDVNYYAGADIVLKNEEIWKEIRSQSEKNIQKAELTDKQVTELNTKIKHQLQCIQEINHFFATLPEFTKKIENISNDLDTLQKHILEVEDFLVVFEDIVEDEEMKQNEIDERFKFASYIERKSTETDLLKKELSDQFTEKLQAKEKKLQSTMKERQELFNMAFQQDMQLYKESGIVPKIPTTKAKENIKTVSLEDVVIEDDLGSLDDFVNS